MPLTLLVLDVMYLNPVWVAIRRPSWWPPSLRQTTITRKLCPLSGNKPMPLKHNARYSARTSTWVCRRCVSRRRYDNKTIALKGSSFYHCPDCRPSCKALSSHCRCIPCFRSTAPGMLIVQKTSRTNPRSTKIPRTRCSDSTRYHQLSHILRTKHVLS